MDDDAIAIDVNDMRDESEQSPVATQEAPTEESSADENKSPEVAEGFEEEPAKTEEKPEGEEPSKDETKDEPAEEAKTDEQPQGKAEERKQQLNAEIRDLVAQRNQIREEVEKQSAEYYQPQSVEDLVEQGMSEAEARVQALEQRIELQDYNTRVAEAQLTINHESEKVLTEFPIFNPDSPDFKENIASQAAQVFEKNLIRDPNSGQVIGSHVAPYEFYKTIADAYQVSSQEGQIKGQKATEQMLASAEAPSSANTNKNDSQDKDPFMEAFDSVT